ncbi:MAG TPA: ribosome maturation factor RimP [Nitrospinota bacterium]|jgi:ribosome maturation factor RimP|nr:ribosome maturation factor RimP [Anaerolineales bacterium]HJM82042.1 ribosome maturation factor RimP [Nitrospinota bacterium]|tara:strand:+ start:63815 stop:64285 length:471 start_codon:yes stop_codon:yes gene_type:complete
MTLKPAEDTFRIVAPIVETEGFELVDVELAGSGNVSVLRLFIDKKNGVTVEDCVSISRRVGMVLEVEDIMVGPYTLEVSSPGLTRSLKRPDQWKRAIGKLVLVVLKSRAAAVNQLRFKAVVESADDEKITLCKRGNSRRLEIMYDEVAKARLEVDY